MARISVRFLLLICVACLGVAVDAGAVPSVKRLGVGNSYSGISNATIAKKTSSSNNSGGVVRSASIRTTGLNKPKSVTAGNLAETKNTAPDAARLSVGKYLHNAGEKAGKIKPIGSSSPTNTEIADIKTDIENNYYTKTDIENDYYTKTDIENNYYTKADIDDKGYVTQTQVQNNYYTKEQVNTKITDEMTINANAMAETIATKVAEKLATVSVWDNSVLTMQD